MATVKNWILKKCVKDPKNGKIDNINEDKQRVKKIYTLNCDQTIFELPLFDDYNDNIRNSKKKIINWRKKGELKLEEPEEKQQK